MVESAASVSINIPWTPDDDTCSVDLGQRELESINIEGAFVSDYGNNSLDSLITIAIPGLNSVQKFGSLKGEVNTIMEDVVVRLTSIESNN